MDVNHLYRISDAGNPKLKLNIATKMNCLDNFIAEFKENIYVFADNCGEQTIEAIKSRGIKPIITSLGNSGSWRHVVQYAIDNFDENSYIYLMEDDYLHLPGALTALKEGLEIADYVSLYDHPDKYLNFKENGPNPYILNGGELTRVLRTKNMHWKYTNSTTMSFAAKIKTLKEDKEIWWHFTETSLPLDFFAFQALTHQKPLLSKGFYRKSLELLLLRQKVKAKRIVLSSIPGMATHAELAWLTPLTLLYPKQSWEEI